MYDNFLLVCKSLKEHLSQFVNILKYEQKLREVNKNKFNWDLCARKNQHLPKGNWFIWLIMAGRGFGKTRTGAESIKKLVESGKYKRIALIGETYDQVRKVMVEGESGLLNIYPDNERPTFAASKNQIFWSNGAIATFYTSENYEALRGPQFDLAWIDELGKFEHDQEIWDQLMFCLRLGKDPKVIITTTPRPKMLLHNLIARKDTILTKGSTFENRENLSSQFIKNIENEYVNTKFGNQEINGELLSEENNQLWRYDNFIYEEISEDLIKQMYIIIAIDPAMSAKNTSDETGLIVVGKLNDKYYVLEDSSGQMNCTLWMYKTAQLYRKYNAKKIIVENNQGGDILMSMLKNYENFNWESVRAKENKYTRAMPIYSLYEQKKVIHTKKFETLEKELLNAHLTFKDDRMDALVWGIFSLSKIIHYNNKKPQCWSVKI